MVLSEYNKGNNLIIAYPERYNNEYENLTSFYDKLIELLPNSVQLWVITNNNSTSEKLKNRYRYKKINVLGIKGWDEIWLRDCIGIDAKDSIIKPYYHPQYCSLFRYKDYFDHINKLSRIIIKECLQKKITYMPLVLDGGNFCSNSWMVFLTDKILEDNKELSKSEIIEIIKDYTSLRPEIIERSKMDAIGHTDGFMNFLSEDKVFLSNYPSLSFLQPDIEFVYEVRKKLEQEKFEVIEFYDRPVDEIVACECYTKTKKACFYSARGNYINFLRINNTIILPEYSLPTARESKYYNTVNKETLIQLGFEVKTINCDLISKQGGSLHCLSYVF